MSAILDHSVAICWLMYLQNVVSLCVVWMKDTHCGVGHWKAARDSKQFKAKREVTGRVFGKFANIFMGFLGFFSGLGFSVFMESYFLKRFYKHVMRCDRRVRSKGQREMRYVYTAHLNITTDGPRPYRFVQQSRTKRSDKRVT